MSPIYRFKLAGARVATWQPSYRRHLVAVNAGRRRQDAADIRRTERPRRRQDAADTPGNANLLAQLVSLGYTTILLRRGQHVLHHFLGSLIPTRRDCRADVGFPDARGVLLIGWHCSFAILLPYDEGETMTPAMTPKRVQHEFLRAGAKAKLERRSRNSLQRPTQPMTIDVASDQFGEYFEIVYAADVQLKVLDVRPDQRHLLLSASNFSGEDRFLCGHDEFHWFVAPLRAEPAAKSVADAKESLKPLSVKRKEQRKHRGKHHRKNDVFMRQGEWFFVPCPHAKIDRTEVRSGVLQRDAAGKPHYCDFLYELGEREFACDRYPSLAFFETEYQQILRTRRKAKQWNWRQLPYRPEVYVKGWIRHEDHSPLYLDIWHRVRQNRESDQLSMSVMKYCD